MDAESYRELKVLEELSADSDLTQRRLAKRLQVALGLANLLIRRVVKKGYVKIVNIQENRLRYLLTPQGVVEKARLTYEFLEYSLNLYRGVRTILKDTLTQVVEEGGRNIVFIGTGEIAEIAYVTLKEVGMELVGVVDDQAAGGSFMGLPIMRIETLASMNFDCGVVGWLNGRLEELRKRLEEIGIPEHKIILLEQKGPKICAILPSLGDGSRSLR